MSPSQIRKSQKLLQAIADQCLCQSSPLESAEKTAISRQVSLVCSGLRLPCPKPTESRKNTDLEKLGRKVERFAYRIHDKNPDEAMWALWGIGLFLEQVEETKAQRVLQAYREEAYDRFVNK